MKTIFLCCYLRSLELRREINEGLNVVENWNSANNFILYGKGGEFATNRREVKKLRCSRCTCSNSAWSISIP
jgi:TnpA family transposase